MTTESRSHFQSGSPTGTQYGNPTDDDIPTMQNPAYATIERWNHVESVSPTEPHYVNGGEEIPMTENPAYAVHVYAQVHPTLTRPQPRLAPIASHPNMHNTTDSTSDHDYIWR